MTATRESHDERCGYRPLDIVGDDPKLVRCVCTKCGTGWTEPHPEVERLRAAILDIDAHATPLGEDADGFVTGGYEVSVGSLHRALGVVGHSSPKCVVGHPSVAECAAAREAYERGVEVGRQAVLNALAALGVSD